MPGWTFRAATQPTPNSGGFRLADEEAKGRPRGRGVERARMQFRAPRGRAALAVWQEPGRLLQSRLTSETSGFDTRSAQVRSAGRCLSGSVPVTVGGDFATLQEPRCSVRLLPVHQVGSTHASSRVLRREDLLVRRVFPRRCYMGEAFYPHVPLGFG